MAHDATSILLCEPQCWGFEHAPFNAALIATALEADPHAELTFAGEKSHLACVRAVLARHHSNNARRVRWEEIAIPARNLAGWRRLRSETDWCRLMLRVARQTQARALIVCSLTETGLLVLKSLLAADRTRTPVLATLHGVLASVEHTAASRPWHWALSLRQVLRLPHPGRLTYLALGASIRQCLAESMPRAAAHFQVLDHPQFMEDVPDSSAPAGPIRFGFLGAARAAEKGADSFFRMAQHVTRKRLHLEGEFVVVGFLADPPETVPDPGGEVRGVSRTPLPLEEYCRRARELTYAVGLADPSHYRLVANASFLDALRFGKPGVYLRTAYLQHYFDALGDIGYLCDSGEEMEAVVCSILEEFPAARYRQQCENIQRGRRLFEPQQVAGQLRAILGTVERRLQDDSSG